MKSLRFCKIGGWVLIEIRCQERSGFRQLHHVLRNGLNACAKLSRRAIQDVATFRTVIRNEMEVIPRYAERTRISRRPDADERALDIAKLELEFGLRGIQQPRAVWNGMYCTRVQGLEDAIDSQSIKEIVRLAVSIT